MALSYWKDVRGDRRAVIPNAGSIDSAHRFSLVLRVDFPRTTEPGNITVKPDPPVTSG